MSMLVAASDWTETASAAELILHDMVGWGKKEIIGMCGQSKETSGLEKDAAVSLSRSTQEGHGSH